MSATTISFDLHVFLYGAEWCVAATLPDGTQLDLMPLSSEQIQHLKALTKSMPGIEMGEDYNEGID